MAKNTTIKVKLVSSADTGFYYVTRKNSRTMTDKLVKKKYDPVAKKHVEFRESRIKGRRHGGDLVRASGRSPSIFLDQFLYAAAGGRPEAVLYEEATPRRPQAGRTPRTQEMRRT